MAHARQVPTESGDDDHTVASLSEGEGGRTVPAATGVEFMLDGKVEQANIAVPGSHGRAGSAVVVTAGALHTPKVGVECR